MGSSHLTQSLWSSQLSSATPALQPAELPPNGNPRTSDIIVTPNIGVSYSGLS
jgi:hypothetical protein